MRPSGRAADQLRDIKIVRNFTSNAEGSVLIEFGQTKVICTASLERSVPRWLKGTGQGWITAEYGMLPRATGERNLREASKGKQTGRTLEIQRLIGRSLRAAVDLKLLGENTITVDCDVIQADGGTRTVAISGGCIALTDCIRHMQYNKIIRANPLKHLVASVSVGLYNDNVLLDLDYMEDSNAETDMNVVMTEEGDFIEIQGTAENGNSFNQDHMIKMMEQAKHGITHILKRQQEVLNTE